MSRVRKETEVHWDCPVLQDQLEFQDQQDQKGKGAVKEILELQDQWGQQGFLVYKAHLVTKETGGRGARKALEGLKGIRETKERLD